MAMKNDSGSSRPVRRRKVRVGNSRRLRLFLLSVGLAAAGIGAGLCAVGVLRGRRFLGSMGAVYVGAGAGLILLRHAILHIDNLRRRRYRAQSCTARSVPAPSSD